MNMKDLIRLIESSDKLEIKGEFKVSKDLAEYITADLGYLPKYLKVFEVGDIDESS